LTLKTNSRNNRELSHHRQELTKDEVQRVRQLHLTPVIPI
jgi:hypothetical protein